MNRDQVEGTWRQFTGFAQTEYGELTHDEHDWSEDNREKLEGAIQQKSGIEKEVAKCQADKRLSNGTSFGNFS